MFSATILEGDITLRQIITINQDECIGCGLCVSACQEGAIALVDGKATLMRDDYCDGLGNCLPHCPTGAISIETRQAAPFNREAAHAHMAGQPQPMQSTCQGQKATVLPDQPQVGEGTASKLANFPVQLQLVAVNAPFFAGADLLLSADCAAYASGTFHQDFMQGKVTLVGCPKLDHHDQVAKLAEILQTNDIRSLTVVRMEVPCCGGIQRAAETALAACGKQIPYRLATLSVQGEILPG